MLRGLLFLLLVANGLFFAWTRGWLGDGGIDAQRDPGRIARQVNPDAVRVLEPAAASAVLASTPGCVEAGPFRAAEVPAAEQALASRFPAGSWSRVSVERPGRWVVYVGRFPNREALERRREELAALRVRPEELRGLPEHEPGLTLGSHDSAAAAEVALEQLAQQGVRGARVLPLAAPGTDVLLRIDRGGAQLRSQALALQVPALGAGFSACAAR